MSEKKDAPRECEMHTVNCVCDHCGCSLNNRTRIWVWNEHFGCSRTHVQLAQATTNRFANREDGLNPKKVIIDEFTPEEREIDLL